MEVGDKVSVRKKSDRRKLVFDSVQFRLWIFGISVIEILVSVFVSRIRDMNLKKSFLVYGVQFLRVGLLGFQNFRFFFFRNKPHYILVLFGLEFSLFNLVLGAIYRVNQSILMKNKI